MSNEKIRSPTTVNCGLSPKMKQHNSKIKAEFIGSYLKQNKVTFTLNDVVNLFFIYKLDRWSRYFNDDFTLKDSLFGAAKLIENADPDKYFHSGYGIGFDFYSLFSVPNFDWGKNVAIFGVENILSVHIDNKKKDIIVFINVQLED